MLHLIQVDVNRSKLVKTVVVSSITSLNCYLKDLDKLPAFMARLYYINIIVHSSNNDDSDQLIPMNYYKYLCLLLSL